MRPIKFEAANDIIASEIPVNRSAGLMLSRWKVSWTERLSILLYGKVWLAVRGDHMFPTLLSGNQDFEIKNE